MNALRDAALEYAAAGLPVLPLDGKVPRNRGGLTNASADVVVVAEWWRRWPDANVGVRTGAACGYIVLDVDVPAGLRSLAELERRHGKLRTAEVLTGSGGRHYWFRYPGESIRNSAGALGEGLDVRGDGGYVVAPPSVHESGNPYTWTRALEHAGEWPTWLVADARKRRNGSAPELGDVIREGERNATLASLAGTMRRRGMSESAILAALTAENERCQPPLSHPELAAIAGSIAGYEPEEAGEAVVLEPLDLGELLAGPIPETDWLWHGWVARGELVLVVADPKVGKSLTALGYAAASRLGQPFLDARCERVQVAILDYENPLSEVQKRLRAFGIDAGNYEGLVYYHMPPLDLASKSAATALAALVAEHELGLLVVDSARRAAPGLDENDSQSVSRVFSPLRRVSAESGCTILVVHHARKRFNDNPAEAGQMVRGSGDLVASVDALLYLRAKEPGAFTLETVSRRGLPHEPILVRITEDEHERLELVNEGPVAMAEDKVQALLAKIIGVLHDDRGALERPAIAIRVGADVRNSTFQRALNLGWQRGQLAKSERRVGEKVTYSIAPGVLA